MSANGKLWIADCDESCIDDGHKVLCVGGALMLADDLSAMNAKIDAWKKSPPGKPDEFKWSRVSRRASRTHREFIDGIMGRIKKQTLAFRSVVFQKSDIDTNTFHDGSEDLQLLRFMYQLVLHAIVPLVPVGDRLLLRPDKKNMQAGARLADLHGALNNGIRNRYGRRNVVCNVQPIDSKSSHLCQIVDILLGAVQFHNNERDLGPTPSPKKIELAQHVSRSANLPNLRVNTPRTSTHFGIWQFRFKAHEKCALIPSL